MQRPQPQVTIAGIPIRIEWSFWIIAVFLGLGAREGWLLVAWVAIVLVSVLVHELGHAVALRAYRQRPMVVLHAFGGLTYGSAAHQTRTESIVVSAAGPITAFVLLGLPAYVYLQTFDVFDQIVHYDTYVIVHDIAWVNIAWSAVNMLPILPLDGGNIAQTLVGRPSARIISIAVAVVAAVFFFSQENQFAAIFLFLFAAMNYGSYQQEKAGPQSAPAPSRRLATLDVPRPGEAVDKFTAAAQAMADGRTDEGLRNMAAAYAARPTGPTTVAPVQQVARSGLASALASMLLAGGGAGPDAVANLRALLHFAGYFGEAATVAALLYQDGRVSRAHAAFDAGCSLARAGDNDRAMEWIRRAIADGFTSGAVLDGEPDLATLRLRPDWPALRALAAD